MSWKLDLQEIHKIQIKIKYIKRFKIGKQIGGNLLAQRIE